VPKPLRLPWRPRLLSGVGSSPNERNGSETLSERRVETPVEGSVLFLYLIFCWELLERMMESLW